MAEDSVAGDAAEPEGKPEEPAGADTGAVSEASAGTTAIVACQGRKVTPAWRPEPGRLSETAESEPARIRACRMYGFDNYSSTSTR